MPAPEAVPSRFSESLHERKNRPVRRRIPLGIGPGELYSPDRAG